MHFCILLIIISASFSSRFEFLYFSIWILSLNALHRRGHHFDHMEESHVIQLFFMLSLSIYVYFYLFWLLFMRNTNLVNAISFVNIQCMSILMRWIHSTTQTKRSYSELDLDYYITKGFSIKSIHHLNDLGKLKIVCMLFFSPITSN